MSQIQSAEAWRLRIPLSEPYHLSHTTVSAFDTVLVVVEDERGETGVGEVTTLEGYSEVTPDECWDLVTDTLGQLVGSSLNDAHDIVSREVPEQAFPATGLRTAVESLELEIDELVAPVVGVLSVNDEDRIHKLRRTIEDGVDTVKVKVGFDPVDDAEKINELIGHAPDDICFRADANQGYSFNEALQFVEAVSLDELQILEQPLEAGSYDEHAELVSKYSAPIMLDEDIESPEDIDKTVEKNSATAVKFKMMKQGGIKSTLDAIEHARERGLQVVLGNGVQSGVGCVYEAMIWIEAGLSLTGEFNGWRKQESPLINGLQFNEGALRWTGASPQIDESLLTNQIVENHQRFGL